MLDKSLITGSAKILVLKLLKQEDMYGYQMISELRNQSSNVFELKAGTLYPLLHSLEQVGAVETYEQEESGRLRKYYHLTSAGEKLLTEKHKEWGKYQNAMNDVLGGLNYAAI